MENKIDLSGKWKLYDETGIEHNALVPGCVHTDLFSLDEMFYEKNSEIMM